MVAVKEANCNEEYSTFTLFGALVLPDATHFTALLPDECKFTQNLGSFQTYPTIGLMMAYANPRLHQRSAQASFHEAWLIPAAHTNSALSLMPD